MEKEVKQYSIRVNKHLNKQLEQLAKQRNQTKAKVIKRLVNDSYLDLIQSEPNILIE